MDSLRNRGLIRVLGSDGGPERVVITSEGMAAIGVEAEGTGRRRAPTRAPTSAEADGAGEAPAAAAEADGAATPAKRQGQGQGQRRHDRAGHRRAGGRR